MGHVNTENIHCGLVMQGREEGMKTNHLKRRKESDV